MPTRYGLEVDIRSSGSHLVLQHEPFQPGEKFEDWLSQYHHGVLVLNIKEAGLESEAIRLAQLGGVKDFFLLDVEFPYLYRASRSGEKRIAVRFSEDESIRTVEKYQGLVNWVWIDTLTELPIGETTIPLLRSFRSCLVCPERWGRPEDIAGYAERMKRMSYLPDAIMTSLRCIPTWIREFSA